MVRIPLKTPTSELWQALSAYAMLTGDRNYCVPIAFAIAKGCDYQEAFELHAAAGRVKGEGMTWATLRDCW